MKGMLPKPLLLFFLVSIVTSASAALVEEFPLNEGATNSGATTVYSTVSTNIGTFINGPT
ncbi:hypothetical protein [Pedosphaera parvula]|uniref:Uncharacterized protein n=1 Tax=Pedosphaera parvula (strain Ellin514) TaxID=320771 RepID=B9XP34_PEDPL|nr:hypothetical protein [Pedosphaera parvula]EEF58390.1 hypothetical protein Cflav_PD6133 [Pedosphaera parvula Ellin514]